MARTLIIGLDGASPHLLNRWRETLPNLNKLMEKGTSGVLDSVVPPRSIPAWYCFATGMNPAKLGVFGFSQRRPGTYDYTFANMTYCRAPTFWQWLNQHGLKTAIVHVPGTFPPQAVDGVMVSGWPAPQNRGNLTYTHPAGFSHHLNTHLNQPFQFLSHLPMRLDNDAQVLTDRLRLLKMHGDVATHTLSTHDWDIGVVVYSPVDRASHQFWRHMDTNHPAHDPTLAPKFSNALQTVYQEADTQVGRLLDLLTEDDTVIIMSDHGFGPAHHVFYLNEWLIQEGYLVLKDPAGNPTFHKKLLGTLAQPLFWLNNISPTFRRLADPFKKRALSNALRDGYVQAKDKGLVRINHVAVDWSRTRAYCPDESSLYLNLVGRDPAGIIQPGHQANTLLDEIEQKLSQIPDPTTGQPIPTRTYRKEAIYNGPYLADAPDMLIDMDDYKTEVMAEMGSGALFAPAGARNGTHTNEGILIANGPTIAQQANFQAGLMDIAPTVLHLANQPIPSETDGQALLGLFTPGSEPAQRPTRFAPLGLDGTTDGQDYTEDEMAQVEKQLRDLGYMG